MRASSATPRTVTAVRAFSVRPARALTSHWIHQPLARFAAAAIAAAAVLAGISSTSEAGTTVTGGAVDPTPAHTTAFRPVGPCRIADTRNGEGLVRLDADTIRVQVTGRCDAPTSATAAVLTLTVAGATMDGFLTAWGAGEARPTASNVNWRAGDTRANSAIVRLGSNGAVDIYVSGTTQVIVDVTGTFAPASSARAGRFIPIDPVRSLDTRGGEALAPNTVVNVRAPQSVPADALAVAVNVTAAGAGHAGHFTAFPGGSTLPDASMLNTDGWNQTRAAASVVPVSSSGLSLYSSGGGHVVVDITGYFTGSSAGISAVGLFVPLSPSRLHDSRDASSKLSAGSTQRVGVNVVGAAIVGNWTMVDTDGAGFLSLRAAGTPFTESSNANAAGSDTVANMAITAISNLGVDAYSWGGAHLIADLHGYFTGSPQTAPTLPSNGTVRGDGRLPGPRHADRVYRVLYVGDSMASETKDTLRQSLPTWEFDDATFGGTAPCDRVGEGSYTEILDTMQPDFVVISFLGNNITSCTDHLTGPALLEQYRRDITSLCRQAAPANCVLVGQAPLHPSMLPNLPPGEPTGTYAHMAAQNPWLFIDAGAAVEDADGGYVPALRSWDTVHFSTEGAARYGYAIGYFLTTVTETSVR
jgi:hypothetical protein